MTFLLVGAAGQLGSALRRQLDADAVALERAELDITDREAVLEAIPQGRFRCVINCAADTHVDRAELEPEPCRRVNTAGPGNLAEACQRADVDLVHVSTDYVFGGDRSRKTPYRETDAPAPLGVYGRTKLDGERLAAAWRRHYVVRTCGLYGISRGSTNFVEKMLQLAEQRDHLRVVNDQHCTPTYAKHLAAAILKLIETREYGLYHIVNRGETTWYEFAREIFARTGNSISVTPIPTSEYPTPAMRPGYSVLDTSKYQTMVKDELPTWRDALGEYLADRDVTPS